MASRWLTPAGERPDARHGAVGGVAQRRAGEHDAGRPRPRGRARRRPRRCRARLSTGVPTPAPSQPPAWRRSPVGGVEAGAAAGQVGEARGGEDQQRGAHPDVGGHGRGVALDRLAVGVGGGPPGQDQRGPAGDQREGQDVAEGAEDQAGGVGDAAPGRPAAPEVDAEPAHEAHRHQQQPGQLVGVAAEHPGRRPHRPLGQRRLARHGAPPGRLLARGPGRGRGPRRGAGGGLTRRHSGHKATSSPIRHSTIMPGVDSERTPSSGDRPAWQGAGVPGRALRDPAWTNLRRGGWPW